MIKINAKYPVKILNYKILSLFFFCQLFLFTISSQCLHKPLVLFPLLEYIQFCNNFMYEIIFFIYKDKHCSIFSKADSKNTI